MGKNWAGQSLPDTGPISKSAQAYFKYVYLRPKTNYVYQER